MSDKMQEDNSLENTLDTLMSVAPAKAVGSTILPIFREEVQKTRKDIQLSH
jgi:hypothetical protein